MILEFAFFLWIFCMVFYVCVGLKYTGGYPEIGLKRLKEIAIKQQA